MMKSFVNESGKMVIEREHVKTPQGLKNLFTAGLDDGAGPGAKLQDPYAQSVWVMRAIKHVAGPIASVPLVVTKDKRGGDVVVDDSSLTTFLEKPFEAGGGVGISREDGLEASVGWLKLKGEYFWILDDSWLKSRAKKRSRIMIARPDEMREILDGRDGPLIGWEWRRGTRREHLIPEQVIQVKNWNPSNPQRGLAEWEAALMAASSDYAAGVFARNLSENNGDRGPLVIGKDGVASQEQIDQVTAQLRQKRRLARKGDFRAVFMTGDIEVKDPGLQAVDASFVTQRLENRHEIFVAFGVPPSMASLVANYSVGSASDRYRLIEDSCVPTGVKVCQAFETVVTMWFGGGETYFCAFDWDEHSTMQEVRGERFKSATEGVDRGMPWKTVSEYFRLKLPEFGGWDVGRVPFNLVAVEGAAEVTENPEEEGSEVEEDPVEELEKIFRGAPQQCRVPSEKCAVKGTGEAKDDPERRALWERVHRNREPWEKRFASRFKRHLMEARRKTLENLEEYSKTELAVRAPSDALTVVFDLGGWLPEFLKGMLEVSRNVMERAGFELWSEELEKDDPLTMPAAETLAALRERENKLVDVGTRVWNEVRGSIDEGIREGDTTEELAGRVKEAFNGVSNQRARTIAVTETTVAYEVGRDLTFRAAGVEWTEWLSSGDGRERDSHRDADGQKRELDDTFYVGGSDLKFPGDPDGPPEEVINCRCVRIAAIGPESGDVLGNEDSEEVPF